MANLSVLPLMETIKALSIVFLVFVAESSAFSQVIAPLKPNSEAERWAILVQLQNPKRLRVVEGERICNVPIGGTISLKTQSIRSGVVVRSTTHGVYGFGGSDSVASHRLAEVKGYEVEVYLEGQRVIVDIQPPDVQQEIDTRKTPIRNDNTTKAPAPTPTTVPPLP